MDIKPRHQSLLESDMKILHIQWFSQQADKCLIHYTDDSLEVQKHSGEWHRTGGKEGRESNTHRDPKIRTGLFQLANEQRIHWAKERAQGHCRSKGKGQRGRHWSKKPRSLITCLEGHSLLERRATESFELACSHYHYEQILTSTLVWSSVAKSSI